MDGLIPRLASLVEKAAPPVEVRVSGEWSQHARKAYRNAPQLGSGEGAYADVVDHRWHGTMTCGSPVVGLAFLVTPDTLYWVRSAPPALEPTVDVSLHAWAEYRQGRATFASGFHGSYLPGVPYECGDDPSAVCTIAPETSATGRAWKLAEVPGATFVLVLVPRNLVKVGRNRLWRFCDDFAANFPSDLRVLAHGRSGTIPFASPQS
jgi:hypothetical protein